MFWRNQSDIAELPCGKFDHQIRRLDEITTGRCERVEFAQDFFCAESFAAQGFFQSLAIRWVNSSSSLKHALAASSHSFITSRTGESLGNNFRNRAVASLIASYAVRKAADFAAMSAASVDVFSTLVSDKWSGLWLTALLNFFALIQWYAEVSRHEFQTAIRPAVIHSSTGNSTGSRMSSAPL